MDLPQYAMRERELRTPRTNQAMKSSAAVGTLISVAQSLLTVGVTDRRAQPVPPPASRCGTSPGNRTATPLAGSGSLDVDLAVVLGMEHVRRVSQVVLLAAPHGSPSLVEVSTSLSPLVRDDN